MQRFAFPLELEADVLAKWEQPGDGAAPPLPTPERLRGLLELAFIASLQTEEGRPLTFTLCCTPAQETVERSEEGEAVETWRFVNSRPLDLGELRRLAVATDLNAAAIWVEFSEDPGAPLKVRGLLNLGLSWAMARHGFSYRYESLPWALNVRVDGPGTVTVYRGAKALSALSAGGMREAPPLEKSLVGVHGLLEEGLDVFRRQVSPLPAVAGGQDFGFGWSAYLNVLVSILNAIRGARHGGALIIARPGVDLLSAEAGLIRPKYRIDGPTPHLAGHFLSLLRARQALLAAELPARGSTSLMRARLLASGSTELHLAYLEARTANTKLSEACMFVAHLAGTDGAVVMGADLPVLGFGAEILLERATPAPAYEVAADSLELVRKLDAEQFGMRHRSAMRLCATTADAAVFVVSQDGGASLVFQHEGRVCVRPNLSTVTAAM